MSAPDLRRVRRLAAELAELLGVDGIAGGGQSDPDSAYMFPSEAAALLALGDVTERERRHVFEKLRSGVKGLRTRLLRGNTLAVHAVDWLELTRRIRRASPMLDDWAQGVEVILAEAEFASGDSAALTRDPAESNGKPAKTHTFTSAGLPRSRDVVA